MRQTIFLTSPDLWQHGHGLLHPLKPERLQRTFELLQEYGAFKAANVNVISPRPATNTELTLFHTQAYVDLVHSLSQGNSHHWSLD